jgi:murein DD-endopeptidase MepM/ murein hydrolase activator NlpD
MDIIVVSGRLAQARTYRITRTKVWMALSLLCLLVTGAAVGLHHAALRYALANDSPYLRAIVAEVQAREARKTRSYLRQSLDALAERVGSIQAHLLQLDALGERVSAMAGLKPQDLDVLERLPEERSRGQGGALVKTAPAEPSLAALDQDIGALAAQVDDGHDRLRLLEWALMEGNARRQLTPSAMPVPGAQLSSGFGWRTDPLRGDAAFHEGMDFVAEQGAPILAAAGGLVVASELDPQYGNMIDIDHGNGLVTRYGHASRRLVSVGEVVSRGAKIGEVGSTGRSTGPHPHFEVRLGGVAQNPARYLRPPG